MPKATAMNNLLELQRVWLADLIRQQRRDHPNNNSGILPTEGHAAKQSIGDDCGPDCCDPRRGRCNERVLSRVFFITINCLLFASVMMTDTPASRGYSDYMTAAWFLFYTSIISFVCVFWVNPGYVDQVRGYYSFVGLGALQNMKVECKRRRASNLEEGGYCCSPSSDLLAIDQVVGMNPLFRQLIFDRKGHNVEDIRRLAWLYYTNFPLPGSVIATNAKAQLGDSNSRYDGRSSIVHAVSKYPIPLLSLLFLVQRMEALSISSTPYFEEQHFSGLCESDLNEVASESEAPSEEELIPLAKNEGSRTVINIQKSTAACRPFSPFHVQLLARIALHPRFCAQCCHIRPVGARHCSICGHCVARFDHHCPLTATCIGARNHWIYLYLVTSLALLTGWAAVQCFNSLYPPYHPRLLSQGWKGLLPSLSLEGDITLAYLRSNSVTPKGNFVSTIQASVWDLLKSLFTLDFRVYAFATSASPLRQNWSWCLHVVCIFLCLLLSGFTGALSFFHTMMMFVGTTTYELNRRRRNKERSSSEVPKTTKDKISTELTEIVEVKAQSEANDKNGESQLNVEEYFDNEMGRSTETEPMKEIIENGKTSSIKEIYGKISKLTSNSAVNPKKASAKSNNDITDVDQSYVSSMNELHSAATLKQNASKNSSKNDEGANSTPSMKCRNDINCNNCSSNASISSKGINSKDEESHFLLEQAYLNDPALQDFREGFLGNFSDDERNSMSDNSIDDSDDIESDESDVDGKLPDYSQFIKAALERQKKEWNSEVRLISRDADGHFSEKSHVDIVVGDRIVGGNDGDPEATNSEATLEFIHDYGDDIKIENRIDEAFFDDVCNYIEEGDFGQDVKECNLMEYGRRILSDRQQSGDIFAQAQTLNSLDELPDPTKEEVKSLMEEKPVCCGPYPIKGPFAGSKLWALILLLVFRAKELFKFLHRAPQNAFHFFTGFKFEPVWFWPLYQTPPSLRNPDFEKCSEQTLSPFVTREFIESEHSCKC